MEESPTTQAESVDSSRERRISHSSEKVISAKASLWINARSIEVRLEIQLTGSAQLLLMESRFPQRQTPRRAGEYRAIREPSLAPQQAHSESINGTCDDSPEADVNFSKLTPELGAPRASPTPREQSVDSGCRYSMPWSASSAG